MRKTAKFTEKYLDKLIEEATTDAYNESEQAGGFFAICSRGKATQAIPILDLPMPNPRPEGAEWIDAYRRWYGN